MAPCISVNSLNCILKSIGSQCNRFSAAVMLCWSRRRKPRTTLAAARWTYLMQLHRHCSASNMIAMCNVPSCQAVMRKLVYRFTIHIWRGVQTNYYVTLAAVISHITHELENTGCRHFMCIFVREYYCYSFFAI